MGPRKFIAVFKTAHHLSLSWDILSRIQILLRSILLLLYSHIRQGFRVVFIPLVFPTKTVYAHLFFPMRATCNLNLIVIDLTTKIILEKNTDHRVLDDVVSSRLSLPRHTWAKMSLSVAYFQKRPDCVPASMWQTKFHTFIKQKTNL